MSRIIWLIIAIIVGAVFVYGAHLAYGETFRDTIQFPIPDNIPIDGVQVKKQITHIDDSLFEFTVTYRFSAQDIQKWYDELTSQKENVLICPYGYDEETEQCLDQIDTSADEDVPKLFDEEGITVPDFVPAKKSPLMVKYERANELCLAEPPTDSDEKIYCILVADIDKCIRGTGYSAGITHGSFITSYGKLLESTEFPKARSMDDSLAKLYKAKLECQYQRNILEPLLFGPEAFYKGEYFGTLQPYHADKAIIDDFWKNGVPNHEPYQLDAHDFLNENQRAFDAMCNEPRLEDKSKESLGCNVIITRQVEPDGSCREGMIHSEDKTYCIMKPITLISKPQKIGEGNPYWLKNQYDTEGDAAQLDKIEKIKEQQFYEARK